MKRRTWLRTASATFIASLAMANRRMSAEDKPEPPDGPDDEYSPYPPSHPRNEPIAVLTGEGRKINRAAISDDGARVVSVEAGIGPFDPGGPAFKVWDAAEGKPLATSAKSRGSIYALAFSPDGRRIATASVRGFIDAKNPDDPTWLQVWEAATGKQSWEARFPDPGLFGLAITPKGTLDTLSHPGIFRAWKVADGAESFTLDAHNKGMPPRGFPPEQSPFAASADGRRAVSLSTNAAIKDDDHPERTIALWDADAGTCRVIDAKVGPIRAITISPDGSRVLLASANQEIKCFDFDSEKKQFDFYPGPAGGGEGPYYVAYSPDGTRFVLGFRDGSLKVYRSDGEHPNFVDRARGPRTHVRGVAFLKDRLRVVSGGLLHVGVIKWPNGARSWKVEPLWVWDVPIERFPDGQERFRMPGK